MDGIEGQLDQVLKLHRATTPAFRRKACEGTCCGNGKAFDKLMDISVS